MGFISNISLYLLSKKESPKVVKQFFSWNDLKNVLIIANDNQLSDVVDFLNTCNKQSIKTKVIVIYNGKPETAPKPHFEHTIITKKGFDFFQLVKQKAINEFLNQKNDLLINLSDEENLQALSISKLIPSSCKISRFQNPIFDITIDKTNTISEYLKQVVVYLNMIKTK